MGLDNVTGKEYGRPLNAKNPFGSNRVPEPGRNLHIGLPYRF